MQPKQTKKGKTNKRAAMRKKKEMLWALPLFFASLAIVLLLCVLTFSWAGEYPAYRAMRDVVDTDKFYKGIAVGGVAVDDMTLEEAKAYWAQLDAEKRAAHEVKISLNGKKWKLTAENLEYTSDYETVLSGAWAVGRYGSLEDRYQAILDLAEGWQKNYSITSGYNTGKLQKLLAMIAQENNVEAEKPTVSGFDPDTKEFIFTKGTAGKAIDEEEVARDIDNAIANGGGTVEITLHSIDPEASLEELKASYGMISTAKTNASSSNKNRLTNLRVACATISGIRVDPGETFSFNETLGKRTKEKGYKSAGAIENGLSTEQIGGGICQVSTTLFNAVVKADLSIVERNPHTRPSTYIDKGKDAAVNWPGQDFKFRNTSAYPVYIAAEVTKNKRVVISIYGKLRTDGVTIELEPKTTKVMEPGEDKITYVSTLAPGYRKVVEAARKGYKVTTYKVYYDANGTEISREVLCKSTYRASGAVIHIGK